MLMHNRFLRLTAVYISVCQTLYSTLLGAYGKAGNGKWKRTRKAETDMENRQSSREFLVFFLKR